MMIKIILTIAILLLPNFSIIEGFIPCKIYRPLKPIITKEIKNIRAFGFYPYSAEKHERHVEGSKKDKFGNPVRTMQCNYKYVTVAVDEKIIPLKTYFHIKEFPGKLFYACDIGSKIKGKKIDIAVKNKKIAWELPKYVTIQIIGENKNNKQINIFQ